MKLQILKPLRDNYATRNIDVLEVSLKETADHAEREHLFRTGYKKLRNAQDQHRAVTAALNNVVQFASILEIMKSLHKNWESILLGMVAKENGYELCELIFKENAIDLIEYLESGLFEKETFGVIAQLLKEESPNFEKTLLSLYSKVQGFRRRLVVEFLGYNYSYILSVRQFLFGLTSELYVVAEVLAEQGYSKELLEAGLFNHQLGTTILELIAGRWKVASKPSHFAVREAIDWLIHCYFPHYVESQDTHAQGIDYFVALASNRKKSTDKALKAVEGGRNLDDKFLEQWLALVCRLEILGQVFLALSLRKAKLRTFEQAHTYIKSHHEGAIAVDIATAESQSYSLDISALV